MNDNDIFVLVVLSIIIVGVLVWGWLKKEKALQEAYWREMENRERLEEEQYAAWRKQQEAAAAEAERCRLETELSRLRAAERKEREKRRERMRNHPIFTQILQQINAFIDERVRVAMNGFRSDVEIDQLEIRLSYRGLDLIRIGEPAQNISFSSLNADNLSYEEGLTFWAALIECLRTRYGNITGITFPDYDRWYRSLNDSEWEICSGRVVRKQFNTEDWRRRTEDWRRCRAICSLTIDLFGCRSIHNTW